MKHWELTIVCVPHLKAVLSAVERSQLDFYGIDRNFLEIEGALTTFLKIKQVKQQHDMGVYTNSNVIKHVITTQTCIEVEPFDKYVPESKHVDLFIFNKHFANIFSLDELMHEAVLLRNRPDWGGTILKMMQENEHVFLFDRRWYNVCYNPKSHYFKFKPCDTPNLVARYSCILLYPSCIAKDEKQALQALLEPVIFGERLAQRMREAHAITNPALLTQAKGDYEKLCSNLEQIRT